MIIFILAFWNHLLNIIVTASTITVHSNPLLQVSIRRKKSSITAVSFYTVEVKYIVFVLSA